MGDGFLDRNLKRLLGMARPRPEPGAWFRESLGRKLQDQAAALRQPASDGAMASAPAAGARRPAPWLVAAAAAIAVFVTGLGLQKLFFEHEPKAPPRTVCLIDPHPLQIPVDKAVVMQVPRGAAGTVDLVRRDELVAHLELKDGAELELRPGSVPVLSLQGGLVQVGALREIKVKAAHLELTVNPGAEVAIGRGDSSMIKSWLVPGGVGAAAGAALVALLVHHGDVEMKTPESRPVEVAPSRPLVLEVPTTRATADDDGAKKLAQAERKIADLEKRLAASKKEGDKLASELVEKKGVTLDNIAARIADLRKRSPMEVMMGGKTAELIMDLKGLGAAGTQALVDMLKSTDPKDRFIAAKLLEDLKDPAAIAALRDAALNDTDAMAAKMAGHAIALMEDPAAVDALREIYAKHQSWESEVNSLWGLSRLGDAQGIEQSIAYMKDPKISEQARAVLGANVALLIQTPEMMPVVDQTVHDFYSVDQVMRFAIDYYKALGSSVARDRLQAIANDTRVSQAMRDHASQALQN